jgi:hypothetical protein
MILSGSFGRAKKEIVDLAGLKEIAERVARI